MQLTTDEEKIFDGKLGEPQKIAIRLLYSLGELGGADRLIPIKSAHISGVSYKNIGEGGIKFLEKMFAKVTVPTSLNPLGFDIENGGPVNIDKNFRSKQMQIVDIYKRMGIMESYTCTPYYFYNEPSFGDHLSWAESSAIIYVNSVIGARTNRESGPSALAASIIGKTPDHGMHRDDGRRATVVATTEGRLDYTQFAALGLYLGPIVNRRIVLVKGQGKATKTELKALSAALSAVSSAPMFQVEGATPEASLDSDDYETIEVNRAIIDETIAKKSSQQEPELIAIGCPHLSTDELEYIAKLVKGKKKTGPDLFLFTSREVRKSAEKAVKLIEDFGGKVFTDTCMVVSPLKNSYSKTGTNSGKASFYLPLAGYGNQKITFMGIMDLMKWVIA